MATTIFYFSGTGNSLNTARSLAEVLEETELIPIAKLWEQASVLATAEKVGFVFPLYWWGLPDIVYKFIKKIKLNLSNYFFAIITCGGSGSGAAMHQLRKLLKKKSKILNAGFFLKLPDNYLPVYDILSEEKQKKLFEKAKTKIEKIAEIINNNESNIEKEILSVAGKVSSKRFRKHVNASDRKFNVDDKCNSCGICENICPLNNILIVEGKPQWQHKCQRCLACIHFCPQKAIQWKEKTANKGRYHHPNITIKDIINQN